MKTNQYLIRLAMIFMIGMETNAQIPGENKTTTLKSKK
jgi:hypothetical protein